jgi:hypothetical protein
LSGAYLSLQSLTNLQANLEDAKFIQAQINTLSS